MSDSVSPLAGKRLEPGQLVDVAALTKAYYEQPDPSQRSQQVAFGTSGHRGSALLRSFNEAHILAIAQAICLYRREQGLAGFGRLLAQSLDIDQAGEHLAAGSPE